ncbi:hypothetical protein NSU_3930 [Novosphingobium pentaromativorans US6-1]|uniref:Uncharacterized protein n=1 Tax=Novosphingobium pentaromativorans US6-1 TaxID=1088721 RepID=G6EHV8_9SPHN|nr:hypothetical protein NSU_3930 [Novosphingobium pentaromativorans US6-1]
MFEQLKGPPIGVLASKLPCGLEVPMGQRGAGYKPAVMNRK